MGDGAIIEQGTHNELLRDEKGPYSRLVHAQKLRERQTKGVDGEAAAGGEWEDVEKEALKEEPLGRKNTGRSLGSEIIEQRQQAGDNAEKSKDHGLPYLFMRMGKINRDSWPKYLFGTIFASRMQLFCFRCM
jgi:ATP-binding cassette subfamily B (MDR/TAP) protein 1